MLSIELGGACRGSAFPFVMATMKIQADIANPTVIFEDMRGITQHSPP
jgi:hypothetical protein